MATTHSFLPRPWSVMVLLLLWAGTTQPTFACTSDRPGWATHRTLYVPAGSIRTSYDIQWKNALCCVYTHVVEIHSGSDRVTMQIFDGSRYTLAAAPSSSSFAQVAERAMNDICTMSMGQIDCQQQQQCRQAAFQTVAAIPVPAPPVTTLTCANLRCGSGTVCEIQWNGQPQCVPVQQQPREEPIVPAPPPPPPMMMCSLRDVCAQAWSAQECRRTAVGCCAWSLWYGQCQARENFGCAPWQPVPCTTTGSGGGV